MKKLNWYIIVVCSIIASLLLALPVFGASTVGFDVDCEGASGFGDVPAGSTYTWIIRFYDPGKNSGSGVVTDQTWQGAVTGPATFNPEVNWPITPSQGNTQDDSYYWVDIWNFSTGDSVFHAEGHFNCGTPPPTDTPTPSPTDTPTPPPPSGNQGCTPGYWKQDQHFDSWNGYAPDTSFEAVFGRDVPNNPTLLDALKLKGGGLDRLMSHAVAALLNASNPNVSYAYSTNEVISMFQAAFDSGDYETTKNLFDAANNAGCPLN